MGKFGFTAVIGADYSALNNAMKEIDSSSKKLSSELKQINSALKLDPENTVLAAQKLEVMGDAAKEAQKKIEKLESQQEAMNKALQNGDISAEYYREYQREIERAQKTVREFNEEKEKSQKASISADGIKKGFSTAAAAVTAATAAVGAFTGACAAAGKAVFDLAKDSAAAGDNIDKQSQRLGMSAEAYQEWDYVLSQNGGSVDTLTTGINKLNNLLDDAKNGSKSATETFKRLGLSVEEVAGMSQEERFNALIAALQGMEDESERNAAANDILGKSYTNIIPLLNSTEEATQALKQKAHDTNMIMSDEAVASAVAYTDAMDTLQRSFTGFTNQLGAELLPGLTEIIKGITDVASGAEDGSEKISNGAALITEAFSESIPAVVEMISAMVSEVGEAAPQAVSGLVSAITDLIPSLGDAAGGIVSALIDGITEALPELGEGAAQIITELLEALISALPQITEGAAEMVAALVNGISESLPELIPAAVEAVMAVAQGLIDNIDILTEAAINLISALEEGLVNAVPELIKAAPKLMISLNQAIVQAVPQLLSAVPKIFKAFADAIADIDWRETGDAIVAGIAQAVTDGISGMKEQLGELGNAFKELFGIEVDDAPALSAQEEAEARLDEALKELEEKRGQIPEEYRQIQEELKKGAEETADKLTDTSTEIAEAAGSAADVGVSETKSENDGEESGVNQKSDMLDKELEELEHKYKTHKVTEEQYWSERKSTLEKYRDDDSEEWNALYDKVTEHYTKLAEAEKKAKEAALKEDTAEAKKRFDALYSQLSDEKITREQFNDEYAALTEELAQKQIDISEYAADKIASYDEKVRKEKMTAWEKASKEITDKITKTYENVTQAYEKAKSQLISSAKLIDQKVTDTSGADRYILTDFEKKRKELAKYRKDLEKLKETGISDDLMEQVMSLSYDSGERQGYISELLKMSDSQRKKYYKDVDAFYADAGKTAAFEVQDDLTEADRIAKEGIESIYGSMPADAYQKGVETAQSYIDGINKTMADADALRSMGSDFGERSQNSKMQSAASGSSGSTYSPSGTAQGGKSSFYSGDTKIVINVAGKNVIVSTIEELIRKGRLADSRR